MACSQCSVSFDLEPEGDPQTDVTHRWPSLINAAMREIRLDPLKLPFLWEVRQYTQLTPDQPSQCFGSPLTNMHTRLTVGGAALAPALGPAG